MTIRLFPFYLLFIAISIFISRPVKAAHLSESQSRLNLTYTIWGQIGHRAVGLIAESYLKPDVLAKVRAVLSDDSLAEVSTWMDEVRADSRYDSMNTWHYVTIPEGRTYETSDKEPKGDIIKALETVIAGLKNGNLDPKKEAEYLKIVVHLIGDLHQPLHNGNGTDRGGNNLKVKLFGDDTNLHSVWDSGMINSKNLSSIELADYISNAGKNEIESWRSGTVRDWCEESRKLLPQVYDIPDNKRLGYSYIYRNWSTVEVRLHKAGVRLAWILNSIYG